MKKILVITDSSNQSKNALIYAKQLADLFESKIFLYNTSNFHSKLNEDSLTELVFDNDIVNNKTIENEINHLANFNNVSDELALNKELITKDILLIEKNENIDLVITGTRASYSVNQSILNNMMVDLIKETLVPILIIPETTTFKKMETIVFTVDFISTTELKMHQTMKDFLSRIKPKIFVLNVVKENAEIMKDRIISEKNIEKYFENEKHIYSFIENNDLINGLTDFITCNNIDMITMLPHNHNFLENIFIESQTKKMVFNTTIPLIIFPLAN